MEKINFTARNGRCVLIGGILATAIALLLLLGLAALEPGSGAIQAHAAAAGKGSVLLAAWACGIYCSVNARSAKLPTTLLGEALFLMLLTLCTLLGGSNRLTAGGTGVNTICMLFGGIAGTFMAGGKKRPNRRRK